MPINLLFLCTGNSARSLIAEGVCANLVVKHSMRFQLGHIQLASPIRMPLRFYASMILTLGLRALKAGMNLLVQMPPFGSIITVCDNAAVKPVQFGQAAQLQRIGACQIQPPWMGLSRLLPQHFWTLMMNWRDGLHISWSIVQIS